MIDWLQTHWMEVVGTFFALVYLYLSVREHIWLWVTGFLSSFFYLIVFFDGQLYADMGLQVYYLLISVYGWFAWKRGRMVSGRHKMPITRIKWRMGIKLIIASILVYFLILGVLLKLPVLIGISESDLPHWDAFTTTGGIIATWMLTKKIIEHWLIWIIVDLVSSVMYIYKDLEVTVFLYLVYTLVAVIGYREWIRKLKYRDQ